jgi:hypothetical protein
MQHTRPLVALAFVILAAIGCGQQDRPTPSLVDTWSLLSFTDHGVKGVTSGTATFRDDGTYEIIAAVTFPGEPTDSFDVSGTYTLQSSTVFLTAGGQSGTWSLLWTGTRYLLTLQGPLPTNQLELGPLP